PWVQTTSNERVLALSSKLPVTKWRVQTTSSEGLWVQTTSNEGLGSKLPSFLDSSLGFKTTENNLPLSETSEIIEDIEINSLENEIWTKEEITKFELLYYKTKDILEKQEDNQKFEEEISLLQNNDFEELFKNNCCEKNCLQSNCDYSVALTRNLNFRNLSKSFQDIYLLGIIAATK
ncbi:28256_t:CDS:2, partial [Racocetra persica]